MTISHETIVLENPNTVPTKEKKATVIKWKGQDMIRTHSLRASVQEALNMFKSLDVVKIGIVGEPSTGKTTLARGIAHLSHKMQEENKSFPFAYREFGEAEFYDFKGTINALEPANYILYFHDLSFLIEKKQIEEIKHAVTTIRHLPGAKDVKILLIYDYHYTLGLDKYLRQADFRYFTSLGSSEMENMEAIVGKRFKNKLYDFKEKYIEMKSSQKCTFAFPNHQFFIYNYKNPFVVCLFWNESNLRYIVFPIREWIDKICPICSFATDPLHHAQIDTKAWIDEGRRKCGKYTFDLAMKITLIRNGLDVWPRNVKSAEKYISRFLERKQVSYEQIMTTYGWKITRANISRALNDMLPEVKQETLLPIESQVN